jgi:hypothetical protein
MARSFDWIGARTYADPEWPAHLTALYEACRQAYDLETMLSTAAKALYSSADAGVSPLAADLLSRAQFDAMAVWQAAEQVARPYFEAWEARQRAAERAALATLPPVRAPRTPRIVPVLTGARRYPDSFVRAVVESGVLTGDDAIPAPRWWLGE